MSFLIKMIAVFVGVLLASLTITGIIVSHNIPAINARLECLKEQSEKAPAEWTGDRIKLYCYRHYQNFMEK